MMSLVDYASSSSDDDVQEDTIEQETRNDTKQVAKREPSPPKMPTTDQRSGLASNEQVRLQNNAQPSVTPVMKLPDASLLLNSPSFSPMNGSDHASRVSAAMAENASRKRDSNGLSSSLPRNKVPKGTLRQTKSVPDTVGGLLVPPQLSGRSNVVTEDMGKLFVRKHSELSSELNTSEDFNPDFTCPVSLGTNVRSVHNLVIKSESRPTFSPGASAVSQRPHAP